MRGGHRPGAGRPKGVKTRVMDALDKNDYYLPQYLIELRKIALDPTQDARDRQACLIYLINRSQGTPKSQSDVSVTGQFLVLTPDMLELESRKLAEIANRLLLEGKDANEGQRESQGTITVEDAKKA